MRQVEGSAAQDLSCPECGGVLTRRADDHPEAIGRRLDTFSREVEPVIRYYEDAGRLARIDGARQIPDIERDLLALFL